MLSVHIDTATTWRGGQNQVLLTVMGLLAAGERALLVAHPDGELRRRAAEGLEFVPLAPAHELDLKAGWRLARLLKRVRPDVVHAHDSHAVSMAALGLSMAGLSPSPPLVAARRVDFHLKKHSFSQWKYRQVTLFIAASGAIASILQADGVPAERIVTIHEGIDVDRIVRIPAASVHAELWLPSQAPIVGNVGALVPHKGQRHLIDAAAVVVRAAPDARFVILGEGVLREPLEQHVRHLHLDRHVFLPGFREDVIALLKGFDIFVMSSETEGLGTSVLDAMACRKAVIATRAGGLPEIVEDGVTGVLVPARDSGALADAIVMLLADDARRTALGSAGLARVRERFTMDRMVRETQRAYEQLVSHNQAVGGGR
jgi:glycosyltransferase involved in cell wall biosynthesis